LEKARIEKHSDSRILIYDRSLPRAQTKCLLAWAESFGKEIVNGVDTYASPHYPAGPYSIPPQLRRTN
jgi:hypothetical protein